MYTEILEHIVTSINSSEPCVLVTPIARSGSVPAPDNAAIILRRHDSEGTVGGGILEARAIDAARVVLQTGKPDCATLRLDAEDAADDGMLCGGTVTFLYEPVHHDNSDCWHAAANAANERKTGAFIVELSLDTPEQMSRQWVGENEIHGLDKEIQNYIQASIQTGRPKTILSDDQIRYIDPLVLADDLLVFGGGHVAHALVPIVSQLGFRVWVIDDRASFVTEERFPSAYARITGYPAERVHELPHGSHVFAVVMTRGHKDDQEIIEKLLEFSYRYIGMIGSSRKKRTIWDQLLSRGVDASRLDDISCPIGLPLGGSTPAEIAVSIAAELLTVRYNVPREAVTVQKSDSEVSRSAL